jgi:hypothetical protein
MLSTAMTAWSAKVVTSSICLSVKDRTWFLQIENTPMGMASRNIGTPRIVRIPRIELRQGVAHRDRSPDRSLGVVLVDRGHAEDRHCSVAGKLLDGTVDRFDSLPHLPEEGREERAQCLGVVARRELRRSGDVREEGGHELPLVGQHSAGIVA